MGPKIAELLQARASGHQGIWEDVKTNSESEDDRGLAKEAKDWEIEGKKRRISRKEFSRLINEFELECCMAQTVLWNLAREREKIAGERCHA